MTAARKQAETVAAEVMRLLGADPRRDDGGALTNLIDQALTQAAQSQERRDLQRIAEVQAAAHAHLSRLLNASPAVIYCRAATGDYEPTFVSDSVTKLFGCSPREYLGDPYFWRHRVHPDDIEHINAWVERMFDKDRGSIEYRVRRPDGTYMWLHDRQHVVRDAEGQPIEIVGSWTDVTERREAEQAGAEARAKLDVLLSTVPVVVYSFAATGDYKPNLYQPEHHADPRLCPQRLSHGSGLLAAACPSRRPQRDRGEAGRYLQEGGELDGVPLPPEGRLLLLGQR